MKMITIGGVALLALVASGRPALAQSANPDFDAALLSIASPAPQTVTAATTAPEGIEAPDGVEAPEGVEGPDTPGDVGPNIDHQFEGVETGENGNGVPGSGGGG